MATAAHELHVIYDPAILKMPLVIETEVETGTTAPGTPGVVSRLLLFPAYRLAAWIGARVRRTE